jgi:hypothetical protein
MARIRSMSCWARVDCTDRFLFFAPVLCAPSMPFSTAVVVMASTTAPIITSIRIDPRSAWIRAAIRPAGRKDERLNGHFRVRGRALRPHAGCAPDAAGD